MNLQQIAIVTGGASGLGAAVAEALSAAGAQVAILDKASAAYPCDITQEKSVQEALTSVIQQLGVPRICINCAGVASAKKLLGKYGVMPLKDFQQVIDINLIGTVNIMRLFAEKVSMLDPLAETGERGIIINTASIAAFEGQIGQTAYSASKGGVVSMTLPAARELAQFGIRVMTIAPGIMETPMMAQIPDETTQHLTRSILFPKRLGQPAEFAKLVMHIIENTYLNGSVIRLDGGLRIPVN